MKVNLWTYRYKIDRCAVLGYWPFVKRVPFAFENSYLWLALTSVVTFALDT